MHDEATVGKDNHSGVYLLGFKRTSYSRPQFLSFKWSTSQLFKNVVQYFTAIHHAVPNILKVRIDLNHHKDFKKVVGAFSTSLFIKLLIIILLEFISYFEGVERLIIFFFTFHKTYRGPPQLG